MKRERRKEDWFASPIEIPGIAWMVVFAVKLFQLVIAQRWNLQRVAARLISVGVVREQFVDQTAPVDRRRTRLKGEAKPDEWVCQCGMDWRWYSRKRPSSR